MNAPRLEVEHEQHEVAHQAADGEHFNGEEVSRGDGAPVCFQEGLPRHGLSPHGRRLDAVLREYSLDGRASEVQPQILNRAAKTRVAPRRVLTCHDQQQLDRIAGRAWAAGATPARRPIVLCGDLLSVPAQDRLGRRERCHQRQSLSTERFSLLRKQPSLRVGQSKAFGPQPRPQHAVLGAQVLDGFALGATEPAGDQQDEELKRSGGRHVYRLYRSARPPRVTESRLQSEGFELRNRTR